MRKVVSLLKNRHSTSGSFPDVLMMKSTDLLDFDNSPAAREIHRSPIRRVLVQGKVRSHTVVILKISV